MEGATGRGKGMRKDLEGSVRFVGFSIVVDLSSLMDFVGDFRKLVIWVWTTCSFRGGERKETIEDDEDGKDGGLWVNGVRVGFGVRINFGVRFAVDLCFDGELWGAGWRLEG